MPAKLRRLREPFESQIVRRYQRSTDEIDQLLPELYLRGLSLGDFEPVSRTIAFARFKFVIVF